MFKIAFIYPGYENLGIEYLSSNLKKNSFSTRLFLDPVLFSESGFINNRFLGRVFSSRKMILRDIISYHPDLICFSVITDNYSWAKSWAQELKLHCDAPIIFGGIHATSVPEKVITENCVDYICVGEGDTSIVELAQALNENQDSTSIAGIWAKQGEEIFKNNVRVPADLDSLPFPDKDLYLLAAPVFRDGYLISTVRGCPFECAYCCNNVYHALYKNKGKVLRKRSIGNVLEELKIAKEKFKAKFIHFVDDVFNYDRIWLFDFIERYRTEIGLAFSCYIYPERVDLDLVKALKGAGCFKVQMGLQVVDEGKRKEVLKRNCSQENIIAAIDYFRSQGIFVTCDNILGFPDEKEDDLINLTYFYNHHQPNHCEIFWLRYYPKTEITRWALEHRYIDQPVIENIDNGYYNYGLVKKPYYSNNKSFAHQFAFFLSIFPFLSSRTRLFILRHRLYRFFPKIRGVLLLIIIKIFNRPKYDFNTTRTIKRYLYFIFKSPRYLFR